VAGGHSAYLEQKLAMVLTDITKGYLVQVDDFLEHPIQQICLFRYAKFETLYFLLGGELRVYIMANIIIIIILCSIDSVNVDARPTPL